MGSILMWMLSVVIVVGVAVAVISRTALTRRTKEQWREQVKASAHAVREPVDSGAKNAELRPKKVTFMQLWTTESKAGSGYVGFQEVDMVVGPKVQAPKASSRGLEDRAQSTQQNRDATAENDSQASDPLSRESFENRFPQLLPVDTPVSGIEPSFAQATELLADSASSSSVSLAEDDSSKQQNVA